MIEEYGFEGVDIDFEGSAVSGTDYIAEALRKVQSHFGDDFIITMAPETLYFQDTNPNGTAVTSAYYRLAYKIRDILTICYPQFYNTGGMNGYNGFNAQVGNADFLTSLATLLLENGLRADQVALGLPSTPKAASSGYVSTDVISTAVTSLVNGTSSGSFTAPKAYPTFRGVMTWSINWDATNDYAWAKSMDSLMDSLEKHEQPTKETSTTKTEVTTQNEETTKTEVTTSSSQTEARPTEVIGLAKQSQDGGTVSFVWGQTNEQMESGQTYRVYADGKYVETFALATATSYTFTTNGKHIIKVTANLNGYETEGQTIEVTIEGLETSETTKVAETTKPGTATSDLASRLLIGYYHTWDNSGNPFIKLRDVDKNWDVINISFAEPVSAGSTDGKMKFDISGLTADYTKADFKNDVKALQAQGKKIVLSIGGYEGYFSLTSQSAVNQFVSDIKSIVDEYGFDGIDIDLEQSSVQFESGKDTDINNPTSPKIVNMINAIRTIVNSYGDDFILSWAPETFYVQLGYQFYGGINQYCDARAGVYLPMINALRNETTYVHVQLYNSSPMIATDNQSYNMGTKEGIVAMCNMLLNGFYVNNYYTKSQTAEKYFAPLRPDQVVIGVPSSASAAGSGQVSNETLQSAFTELNNAHPGLRGIMTWSINWDSSQNKNSFAQSNGRFLDSLSGEETTKTPETTTKVAETTTKAPEETTKTPETTTKVAETTKAPETTTKAPETTTKTPETTTKVAETTTKVSETTTKTPETTTKVEETTTKASETTKVEETTTKVAETTTKVAETTTKVAETTTKVAETTKVSEATTKNDEITNFVTTEPQQVTTTGNGKNEGTTTTNAVKKDNGNVTTNSSVGNVKVPKVKIKKAIKKRSAKKAKIKLRAAKGVNGYQIKISKSKKFKKAKTKKYKKAKFTIKKLKANKKYYIRVRAYKVVNGITYYGKWSKRKIKMKK